MAAVEQLAGVVYLFLAREVGEVLKGQPQPWAAMTDEKLKDFA